MRKRGLIGHSPANGHIAAGLINHQHMLPFVQCFRQPIGVFIVFRELMLQNQRLGRFCLSGFAISKAR